MMASKAIFLELGVVIDYKDVFLIKKKVITLYMLDGFQYFYFILKYKIII